MLCAVKIANLYSLGFKKKTEEEEKYFYLVVCELFKYTNLYCEYDPSGPFHTAVRCSRQGLFPQRQFLRLNQPAVNDLT